MSEDFNRYYDELKELNEQLFNKEFESTEEKISYLIDKAFKLQYLIMQENLERMESERYFIERIENLARGVSDMQEDLLQVLENQEKIEYLLRK